MKAPVERYGGKPFRGERGRIGIGRGEYERGGEAVLKNCTFESDGKEKKPQQRYKERGDD